MYRWRPVRFRREKLPPPSRCPEPSAEHAGSALGEAVDVDPGAKRVTLCDGATFETIH